jgi:vacuolar protein sorting-associated protein 11
LERALSIISNEKDKEKTKDSKKDEILSPLLVLEILQSKPNLKFKVIKKYLLNRLEVQDRIIKKNNKQVEENMSKIKGMRSQIQDLKTKAKNFNAKKCDCCQQPLSLPTIHFMCGHTFHDQCISEDTGRRYCNTCYVDFKDIIDKKEQYDNQAQDP